MCGIFGIYNSETAAQDVYLGIYSLQHRGQEGAGIITGSFDEEKHSERFHVHKGFGLVSEVFKDRRIFENLKGSSGIGHTRYSTTGSATVTENVQPFNVKYQKGNLAIGHNGNISNSRFLRKKLIEKGVLFKGTSDTEIFLHLIAQSKAPTIGEKLQEVLPQVDGAYSLVLLTDNELIAVRDPYGFRPLSLGEKTNEGIISNLVASETCAFDILSANYIREIEPGEILIISKEGMTSTFLPYQSKRARCIFEYVYFSRPDSFIFGESVDKVRRKLGKNLSIEAPPPIDEEKGYATVISVPDSSNTATVGYITESIKNDRPARWEIGLIRNHYIGRTFINPSTNDRHQQIRAKFNIVKGVIENRNLTVVDDSIVRGTTSKRLVQFIKEGNPKEIHLRITSPPIISQCYYGIDISKKESLIACQNNSDVEKIRKKLDVDSLCYLSVEKLIDSAPRYDGEEVSYCTGCFTGKYPTPIESSNGDKDEYD